MSAVRLVLDSSTFRNIAPAGIVGRSLAKFANVGVVKISLPSIVVDEVVSGLAVEATTLSREQTKLREWAPESQRAAVGAALDAADAQLRQAEVVIRAGVDEWLQKAGVDVIPIAPTDAEEVFKRYFQGEGAFRSRKNRADFPDAFILAAIERLAQQAGSPVHFVCNDKALREAAKKAANVVAHASLPDFFKVPEVATSLSAAKIVSYFVTYDQEIRDRLSEPLADRLTGTVVEHADLPCDDATISHGGFIDSMTVDNASVELLDEQAFVTVDCRVEDVLADFNDPFGNYDDGYIGVRARVTLALEVRDENPERDLEFDDVNMEIFDVESVSATRVQKKKWYRDE